MTLGCQQALLSGAQSPQTRWAPKLLGGVVPERGMPKRPQSSGSEVGGREAGVHLTRPEETGHCGHRFGFPSAGCGVLLKSKGAKVWRA